MYDLIIIGAGVSGCCIAREISRYKIKACVIEKGDDVASGTSKANTGVIPYRIRSASWFFDGRTLCQRE